MKNEFEPQPKFEIEYVGFWARTFASLLDSFFYIAIIYSVLLSLYGVNYLMSDEFQNGPVYLLVSWVLPVIAVIAFWFSKSATPGKMIISPEIADAQTLRKPSDGQFIGRYFAYAVSIIPFILGILWVAFDSRKQGWHDKLAGTVVVRRKEM